MHETTPGHTAEGHMEMLSAKSYIKVVFKAFVMGHGWLGKGFSSVGHR